MAEPILAIGKHEIAELVGSGGMASVYRGKVMGPMGFEKAVAVKVMHDEAAQDDELVKMFIDEAKLGAMLTHPNIASVLDFGESGGRYWLTMEYVDGPSLAVLLKANKPKGAGKSKPAMDLDAVGWVTAGILKALDYAHKMKDSKGKAMGIVHRDVSPHNVLIDSAGMVKLADFGIATGTYRSEKTETGIVKGKASYMSPEQASGGKVDARTDIYAVGLTMYAMLTGQSPLADKDSVKIRAAAAKGVAVKDIDDLNCPEPIKKILRKALAVKAGDRYSDAAKFLVDLKKAIPDLEAKGHKALVKLVGKGRQGTRKSTVISSASEITPSHSSSGRGLQILIVAAAILLLAGLVLTMTGTSLP